MRKNDAFSLSLHENKDTVEVDLSINDSRLLNFLNEQAPKVIVRGINQPSLNREQLIEFIEREAYGFDDGKLGVLKVFLHGRESQINKHILELRKIMRKLARQAKSAKVANDLLSELENKIG